MVTSCSPIVYPSDVNTLSCMSLQSVSDKIVPSLLHNAVAYFPFCYSLTVQTSHLGSPLAPITMEKDKGAFNCAYYHVLVTAHALT